MSATLAPPAPSQVDQYEFAQRLRSQTIACRLSLHKLGTRKALTAQQRRQAAEPFGADHKSMSASKKILDTRDPAFKAVRGVIRRARSYWIAHTTPYPEPGIRLIRKSELDRFTAFMKERATELTDACKALQEKYPELMTRAANALADLFNPGDYPSRIDDEFGLGWDFPSVDPPAYLKQLNPELYEAECQKINARFSVAVEQAEQAFTAQFQQLVTHLVDRLKGGEDGKPKIFRDSAVANLNEFFEQFRQLDIGSNAALQALVTQAQDAVKGIGADTLRDDAATRANVAAVLGHVATQMDELMVNKPDRMIDLGDE